MVGSIDISPDGASLLISFPYREDLVALVRNIPGRRWDRGSKTWKVPLAQVEITVKTFMSYGFSLSPEVTSALTTGGKEAGGTITLGKVDSQAPALTVSALNLRVANVLSESFKEPTWVVGEIENFDKGKGRRRHRYFELVERYEDEDGELRIRAVVAAAIFEKSWTIINRRLRRGGQSIELEDGLKVRVRGRVELYQQRGRYQFVIEDIDPDYTLGDMLVRREKILTELTAAGLRERQQQLPMPLVPLRVGLLTSAESDAFNDFVQTLAATRFSFDITLYPVFVQGERLRPTVTAALEWFAEEATQFDVLVITRGGGSRSELGAWDDLEVARAVAEHPVKVIVGIGHERDESVLDLIATSVKTPTAAAELLADRVREYQERVEDAMLEIADRVETRIRSERNALRQRAQLLRQVVRAGLAGAKSELRNSGERLTRGSRARLREESRHVARAVAALDKGTDRRLERQRMLLQHIQDRLLAATRARLAREEAVIAKHEVRARALDPERVLARGYSILRGPDGRVVRSVEDAKKDDTLDARLRDGGMKLQVCEIHPDSQKK